MAKKKSEKKRIQVVFDMDPADVKQLIEFGSKGPEKISRKELEALAEKGVIRASDYLNDDETEVVFGIFGKIAKAVGKVGGKVVGKVKEYTPVIKEKVVTVVNDIVITTSSDEVGNQIVEIVSSAQADEPDLDLPKE